jgi:hypothetical protein
MCAQAQPVDFRTVTAACVLDYVPIVKYLLGTFLAFSKNW